MRFHPSEELGAVGIGKSFAMVEGADFHGWPRLGGAHGARAVYGGDEPSAIGRPPHGYYVTTRLRVGQPQGTAGAAEIGRGGSGTPGGANLVRAGRGLGDSAGSQDEHLADEGSLADANAVDEGQARAILA